MGCETSAHADPSARTPREDSFEVIYMKKRLASSVLSLPARLWPVVIVGVLTLLGPVSNLALASDVEYTPNPNAARGDVPAIYRWDLTPLFADDAAWQKSMDNLQSQLPSLAAFKGTLSDAKQLEACLVLYFDLHNRVNHCTLYANLKASVALNDDHAQAMKDQSLDLMDKLMQTATFIRSEVLAIDDATMKKAYAENPGMKVFQAYLENFRRRKSRVLNQESERILGLMGDNLWAEIDLNEIPSPIENTFTALLTDIPWPKVHDEDGKEVQMTLASYGRFRSSPNRAVRKEAVSAFLATLRQYQHALAATLAGQCQLDVEYARARGYDTALKAYMDKDGLPTQVYDNLVKTVNEHLEPLHRYMELRKKAMGLDELHLYDLYRPLTSGVEKTVNFDDARAVVLKALKPLGSTYQEILKKGTDPKNGWIDVYPHKFKQSGAFSSSVYGVHPYVLLNFLDSQDDESTLAHEFGHAIHSHLAMTHQPYPNFRYVPFLAEIASTCNEALLGDYLIANAPDNAERAYLLSNRLEKIRTTIYRQTLFAEFERTVHGFVEAGTPVTASLLDKTYSELIHRYYGPAYTVDKNDGMEWAYIPHFYYKYYVYTYATGLSSGIAIANKLRGDDPKAEQEGFLAMLSGGCSEPPLSLLRKAGVDLTKPDAIEDALSSFEVTLDEMEKLLK
jgi:oligoendopeptidase F